MSSDKRIVWIAACALAGVLIAFGGVLSARAGQQNTNGNANSNAGASSRNSNGGSSRNSNGGGSQSSDAKFMTTAAEGGLAEVAAARVALDHAASDAVKQYAQRMIDDHTANNSELTQLAASKGVSLPTAPDAKHQAELDKLAKLSGAQFDAEYVKNSGVKDHEAMEKLMTKESGNGKDADAKAFAAKTLPTVQTHLQMARDMMTSMKNMNANTHANTNGNMSGMNMNANGNANRNANRNSNSNANRNSNSNNSNR